MNQPLTSEMLNKVNASQQKQMIGECIFPKIQSHEPQLANKITGMFLQLHNMELLHLLKDENALKVEIFSFVLFLINPMKFFFFLGKDQRGSVRPQQPY